VEFALVLPMLIVLLLGVADFGRIFAAGISLEAASRDAAEIVALEYERNPPPDNTAPSYRVLHTLAARTVCAEANQLPQTQSVAGICDVTPVIRVCVHDGIDPICGQAIPGWAPLPPDHGCDSIQDDWSNVRRGGANATTYVEVRVCYDFDTLVPLSVSLPFNTGIDLVSLGNIYLKRDATFSVPCWTPEDVPC
jgi:hypothetical protein